MNKKTALKFEYNKEVKKQLEPYSAWISEYEKAYFGTGFTYEILTMEFFLTKDFFFEYDKDFYIFINDMGALRADAAECFAHFFNENPNADIIYPNEDYLADGKRTAPWYKPDFSEYTLLSFNYINNVFAVRGGFLKKIMLDWDSQKCPVVNAYDFLLKASMSTTPFHIPDFLFTSSNPPLQGFLFGNEPEFDEVKKNYLIRKNIKAHIERDLHGVAHIIYDLKRKPLISIIIPSKDNPHLIRTCVESIKKHAGDADYEIIVVDNGSNADNRAKYTALSKELNFSYNFKPFIFNFSKMCNWGAVLSRGELLLFLNDDIEAVTDNFLNIMAGQAMNFKTGCVGAKLIYPDSNIIQHAGIFNLSVGPVHRLHGLSDDDFLYYGHNRFDYELLGVTAACLMVKRSLFFEINGFEEKLEIAYNDVDFCFSIHKKGYKNVIRNDVTLIHYESLTRGNDDAPKKRARLDSERNLLYSRHPEFSPENTDKDVYAKIDPYCHGTEIWIRDSEFKTGYPYPCERKDCFSECMKLQEVTKFAGHEFKLKNLLNTKNFILDTSRVMISIDKISFEEKNPYIYGWSLLTKQDNAFIKKFLLLKNEEEMYIATSLPTLRQDVYDLIKGQKNTYLAGLTVRLKEGALSLGRYQIGVVLVNELTHLTYTDYTDRFLEIR